MCDHHVTSRGVCGSPGASVCAWWMRCVTTQSMAPPSVVSVPQTVRKYSTHFGVLYPRCVSRRWKPMPMPRLPETHHRKAVTASAVQLKLNSAATAATWKMTIALDVAQLMPVFLCMTSTFSLIKPSVFKVNPLDLDCDIDCLSLDAGDTQSVAANAPAVCNSCVIPRRPVPLAYGS